MQVKLINYTQNALETLLYTKNTRLQAVASIEEVVAWSEEKKLKELDYMLKTIQSSWEFVDYTFEITGVSRAFTHQLVRTRDGSYAQQSQRTVDMSDSLEFVMPNLENACEGFVDKAGDGKGGTYRDYRKQYMKEQLDEFVEYTKEKYQQLVEEGLPPQDARSILPTNTATAIIAKFDLRTLSHMAKTRLCTRTQGEYQEIFKAMKEAVVAVHPWAEKFIRVYCSAVGVCQFPNYKECPIKPQIYNPESGKTWAATEGFPFNADSRDWIPLHYRSNKGSAKFSDPDSLPATKEEIEAGFRKMKFEAKPLWKGNS